MKSLRSLLVWLAFLSIISFVISQVVIWVQTSQIRVITIVVTATPTDRPPTKQLLINPVGADLGVLFASQTATAQVTLTPVATATRESNYGSITTCEKFTFTLKSKAVSFTFPATTETNKESVVVKQYWGGDTIEVVAAYIRKDGIWLDIWDPVKKGTFIQAQFVNEPIPQCFLDNAG